MKLAFTLSTSKAAKALGIPAGLKPLLRAVALEVIKTDLSAYQDVQLGVILYTDEELHSLNLSSLGHDWYTDILTFEIENTGTKLEAELYLSIERASENSRKRKKSLKSELSLLVIHGLLHLAGMDDHEAQQKKRMAQRERFFIAKFQNRLD